MRSLFIIAIPRSLSSLVYEHACLALGLSSPGWTSSGEVLNPDRWFGGAHDACGQMKFKPLEKQFFTQQCRAFLDDSVRPIGYGYKDVVQPFIVANWLNGNADKFAVLRIERPLADVAVSMLKNGWRYPVNAIVSSGNDEQDFLGGLIRASRAQHQVAAVSLRFDELIHDEAVLLDALGKLYPAAKLKPIHYRTAAFQDYTQQVLERRKQARWIELDRRLVELTKDRSTSSDDFLFQQQERPLPF